MGFGARVRIGGRVGICCRVGIGGLVRIDGIMFTETDGGLVSDVMLVEVTSVVVVVGIELLESSADTVACVVIVPYVGTKCAVVATGSGDCLTVLYVWAAKTDTQIARKKRVTNSVFSISWMRVAL